MKQQKEIYAFWEKSGFFGANLKSKRKSYSLLIPPPNLTGELHLGHAMQHAILDAIARFKRLAGFDVLLLPGVDHAGIQFEATFDKYLAKHNLSKQKLGRDEWLKRAWVFKEEVYKSVSATWRFLGLSADWSREVFTLDDGPRRAVFEHFWKFWAAGLIYKGPYIVQWCPKCNTAIEDVELEYQEKKETLYYVRYLIEGTKGEYIEIATARPETIFADSGIAVYPNHPKFKKYIGKKAHIPLGHWLGDLIPIFEDKRVEKDFGTGALKITPGHDLLDYEIGKDRNLEIHQVVSKDGAMTALAGRRDQSLVTKNGIMTNGLEGMKVLDARKAAVEWLKDNDALIKEEPYKHSVAVCERCKTIVEPLISEEWFVKVEDMAKGAIKVIKAGKINFLPKNYARILVEWLSNIHDWCISRSLWWGHRIPVWYCTKCNPYQNPFMEGAVKILMELPKEACGKCHDRRWKQDDQVLDTWFSSGLWPLSTLGWPQKTREFKRYFPWDFEISAPEIKYLWIARMIMICIHLTDEIPFKTMFFHGMLRDLLGRKFSKSLGNGIEPQYLINRWGVDATRMALYTYSVPGRDGRVSRQILDERGKNFRNFATKVRNIARFIMELKPDSRVRENDKSSNKNLSYAQNLDSRDARIKDDKWIRDELARLVVKVTNNLERLELHLAVEEIYEFVWHKFADKYVEKSKERRAEAQPTLEYVLRSVLVILHPFMPFLTEELYQKFDLEKSIMLEKWPT